MIPTPDLMLAGFYTYGALVYLVLAGAAVAVHDRWALAFVLLGLAAVVIFVAMFTLPEISSGLPSFWYGSYSFFRLSYASRSCLIFWLSVADGSEPSALLFPAGEAGVLAAGVDETGAAGAGEAPESAVIAAAGDAIIIAPEMERAGDCSSPLNEIKLRYDARLFQRHLDFKSDRPAPTATNKAI